MTLVASGLGEERPGESAHVLILRTHVGKPLRLEEGHEMHTVFANVDLEVRPPLAPRVLLQCGEESTGYGLERRVNIDGDFINIAEILPELPLLHHADTLPHGVAEEGSEHAPFMIDERRWGPPPMIGNTPWIRHPWARAMPGRDEALQTRICKNLPKIILTMEEHVLYESKIGHMPLPHLLDANL